MLLRMRNMECGGLLHHFEHFEEDLKFDCDSEFEDPLALGLDPEGIGIGLGLGFGAEPPLSDDAEAELLEAWFHPDAGAGAATVDFFNDIKTDCMWGMGRKRDLSLTLTDLFDSLADQRAGPLPHGQEGAFGEPPCATLPDADGQIFGLMDVSLSHGQHEDEHPDAKRPALARQVSTLVHRNLPHIEAGRSLLLTSHRRADSKPAHQTFLDHSYFSPAPVKSRTPGELLTPNETSCSEDDDDATIKYKTPKFSTASGIDKKKIAQAVKSLIKKTPTSKSHAVKFRFRMKFEPSASGSSSHSKASDCNVGSRRIRRTSALLNLHCPTPSKKSNTNSVTIKSDSKFEDSRYDAIEMRGSKTGIEVQKFRDHRDLHNSMERQRRVDLRHNFDLLKSAVPDLAINGKASKLNILKQGALYCQRLNKLNNRMKETTSAEQARNMALRKKLQQLESQFHVRRPSARQIKPRRL